MVYASLAQAYSTDAEPYAIRGVCLPRNQTINKQPYLTDDQAGSIIDDVCKRFETETGNLPQRVVVHKSSVFQDSEISGFRRCLKEGVAQVNMVSMRASGLRLISRGDKEVHRGSLSLLGVSVFFSSRPDMSKIGAHILALIYRHLLNCGFPETKTSICALPRFWR